MKVLKPAILLLALVIVSCNANKKAADESASKTVEMEKIKKEMIEKGFQMGTIVAGKDAKDCPYAIQVGDSESAYYLDPINLDESFKKADEKIWFTFRGLRLMNRCEKASPVEIIDIQRRSE